MGDTEWCLVARQDVALREVAQRCDEVHVVDAGDGENQVHGSVWCCASFVDVRGWRDRRGWRDIRDWRVISGCERDDRHEERQNCENFESHAYRTKPRGIITIRSRRNVIESG